MPSLLKSLSDKGCIVAFGTPINLSEWTADPVCARIERRGLREEKRPTVLPGSDLAKTTARVTHTGVGYNSVWFGAEFMLKLNGL